MPCGIPCHAGHHEHGVHTGNNYPLRGGKHDPWEGGTRAAAFLTGGFLPVHLRGTATGDKLVHISDWYVPPEGPRYSVEAPMPVPAGTYLVPSPPAPAFRLSCAVPS